MWDDVIIGNGYKGCSAIKVRDFNDIHENSVSYWFTNVYLGMGMTIFKDTDEGKLITEFIENEVPLYLMIEELQEMLLLHLPKNKLKKAIDNSLKKSFEDGQKAKMNEMRTVLGLKEW